MNQSVGKVAVPPRSLLVLGRPRPGARPVRENSHHQHAAPVHHCPKDGSGVRPPPPVNTSSDAGAPLASPHSCGNCAWRDIWVERRTRARSSRRTKSKRLSQRRPRRIGIPQKRCVVSRVSRGPTQVTQQSLFLPLRRRRRRRPLSGHFLSVLLGKEASPEARAALEIFAP